MNLKRILKKPEFLLVIILIFAIFLRFYFFTGVSCSDDMFYVKSAESIFKGDFIPASNKSQRLAFIYPLFFFLKVFGITGFSLSLYIILTSLGTVVLGYLFGEMFFNKKVGIITAFLMSFFPLNVIYGTRIMPDVPLAFFMGLSVFLFFKGEKSKGSFYNINKKYIFLFLSGIFLVISYLIKPTGIILILFYLAYILLYKRKLKKEYLFLILGIFLIFSIEGAYYLQSQGDFFYHFNCLHNRFSEEDYAGKGTRPIDTLRFYPALMLNCCFNRGRPFPSNIGGYFYYFIFIGILYLLYKKRKEAYPLLIWFLVIYLFMSFGTTSLTSYKIIGKESRYMTIFTLPVFTILGYFLHSLYSKRKTIFKFIPILIVAFLLLSSFSINKEVADDFNWVRGACGYLRQGDVRNIYNFLKKQPEKEIYITTGASNSLEFYFKFNRDKLIKNLENANLSEIKDSYVVVNTTSHEASNKNYREKFSILKKLHKDIPPTWELLKTIGGRDGNLDRSYNPKIYYAP